MNGLLITAFAFGLVATVNPCGFAMLPAYLASFVGGAVETQSRPAALRRAARVSALVSLGFAVVFGVAGLLIATGVRSIVEWIPGLALMVGIGLVLLGITSLRGRYLQFQVGSGKARRGSVFGFGVSYAIASLSCTLPVFLALVATTFAQSSIVGGVAAFLAYGLGTSIAITAITFGLALGSDRLVAFVRGSARYVSRLSGAILIASGGFIVWYWATVLTVGAASFSSSGLVRWIDSVSAAVSSFIGDFPLLVAVSLVAVTAGAFAALRASSTEQEKEEALSPEPIGTP